MTKYSFELKLKIVQEYLAEQGDRIFLAQKYHIKNSANIFEWVTAYKKFGKSGLQRKKQGSVAKFFNRSILRYNEVKI